MRGGRSPVKRSTPPESNNMSINNFPPVVYDVTRLVTRSLNPSPNGIDRVDFALAKHLLNKGAIPLVCTLRGPRLADREKAIGTICVIEDYWREVANLEEDDVYHEVVASLLDDRGFNRATRCNRKSNLDKLWRNWQALRAWGLADGHTVRSAPQGAVYVTATQFLLDRSWYVRWLTTRPDVKLITFVHDLLPIDHPEYFRPVEAKLHPLRLRNACRFGAGVVVASHEVEKRFRDYCISNGHEDIPVRVAALPVSPIFEQAAPVPHPLADVCYFLICGTIEPRKNHLLLLNLWQELAQSGSAPKLLVVGKRGWLNENIIAMMTQCPALRDHVIEVTGLSTPGLRQLMAGARALLMPSFGEGFGLPVAEALAANTPMIVSDLACFKEIAGDAPDYLDPHDATLWRRAIEDYSRPNSPRRVAALKRSAAVNAGRARKSFVETVDDFIDEVSSTTRFTQIA